MSEPHLTRRDLLSGAGAALAAAGLAACGGGSSVGRALKPSVTTSPPATSSTPPPTPAPAGAGELAGPAVAVTHGPRDRPSVALTFHLGPHLGSEDVTLAHQLLDDANQLGAPITVFAVGQWLAQHADLVPRILAGGHELDNHTYTHPVLTDLAAGPVATEIVQCRETLARLAPTQGRYFRPSGTSQATPLILAQAGAAGYRTVVDFDVDPLDYTDPGADAIVERVRAGARPGSIVSLHFGHAGTVSAFPRLVDNLRSQGLAPVLVRDLLS